MAHKCSRIVEHTDTMPEKYFDFSAIESMAEQDHRNNLQIVVGMLITDGCGRLFAQQRSATRRLFPNCWDIVGGHVENGETIEQTLKRELSEETGWSLKTIKHYLATELWPDGAAREHFFIIEVEGDLNTPALESGKVEGFRWITASESHIYLENRPAHGRDFLYNIVNRAFTALGST